MGKKLRKTKTSAKPRSLPVTARTMSSTSWRLELIGGALLVGLGVFFLATSWRKWPDPLIDFGRELYLPWRLSRGAVLYRDVEGHFGPLSQYFNALLFACFKPGLMVLVAVNLVIFTAILALFYVLCRRAWGVLPAFTATAVYISVFGFSQLTGIANYNYATPYAHEATHGMLVSLLLLFVLARWLADPSPRWSFLAGLLFGFCLLLKPEFILAGGLLGLTAALLRWRGSGFPSWRSVGCGLTGVLLPTAAFAFYFSAFFPVRSALYYSSSAWARFLIGAPHHEAAVGVQGTFTGLDQVSSNLVQHANATLLALLIVAVIAAAGWLARRAASLPIAVLIAVVGAAAMGWVSLRIVKWPEAGRCLLGLMLIYTATRAFLSLRGPTAEAVSTRAAVRLLLAVAATALMTRMALNGRIFHYGFYQAAIAGCIIPAVIVGEIPEWLRADRRAHAVIVVLAAALLMPGVFLIARASHRLLALKTATVGEGVDRFYTFPRQIDPTGEIVGALSSALKKVGETKSMLVLPEGVMLNYLARVPSPLPYMFLGLAGPNLVPTLERAPPERVVLISRDLREYGVERYGAQPGGAQDLLTWISEHYRQVAHVGGDPLDVRQRGAILFKRKDAP